MTADPGFRPVSIETLEDAAGRIDRLVARSTDLDRWCSGADWILSTHGAFDPAARPLAAWTADGAVLLAESRIADLVIVAGLEPLWGFACPVIGPSPGPALAATAAGLADRPWHRLVVPGLRPDSERARRTVEALAPLGRAGASEPMVRRVADVSDGPDAWWARRSSRFRRNLRRAERAAADAGIELIDVSDQRSVYHRVLDIERESWKGRIGDGLASPPMQALYRRLVDRLQPRGRLRVVIARRGGDDLAYLLGGVDRGRYRGLQLSYDRRHEAFSLGHLLQLHEVRWAAAHPDVDSYDLGMDMAYKRSWSDRGETTVALVVDRRLVR